jgi:hypothetical protein
MTVQDMVYSFILKSKALDRNNIVDLKTFDVLTYLNDAEDIVIDELISIGNYNAIQGIIDTTVILAAAFVTATHDSVPSGGLAVDMSLISGYRNYVKSETNMTRTAVPVVAVAKNVMNIRIDMESIAMFETNGTNKPIFTNPKYFVEGDFLIVVPDAYSTVVSERISYVTEPTALTIGATSDLPAFLHERIVDTAVRISQETVNVQDLKKQ